MSHLDRDRQQAVAAGKPAADPQEPERRRLVHKRWREKNWDKVRNIRRRYEQKHPEKHHEWYLANRQRLIEKALQRKRARRGYLSSEGLAHCQGDLLLAKTIRGPETIVCLECGLLCASIRPSHLRGHGLSMEQYRDRWGYSRRTGLISEALAANLRARAEQAGNLRPDAGFGTLRSSSKGLTMSREFRLKHRKRMRGIRRPDLSKGTKDAAIVRPWLFENKSIQEIATQAELCQGSVHKRLQAIFGIRVKQKILFSRGEPVTDAWLNLFCHRFGGLTKAQLARLLGLSKHYLQELSAHPKGRCLTPSLARKLVAAEQAFLKVLASTPGNRADYLKTVVPDLESKYEAAVTALTIAHNVNPRGLAAELDHLAQQSRLEVAKRVDGVARATLALLPEALAWLRQQSPKNLPPSVLAPLFLASQYETKESTIKVARKSPDLGQTSPATIRALITSSPSLDHLRPRNVGGRPRGSLTQNTRKRILLAAACSVLSVTKYGMALQLFPKEEKNAAKHNTFMLFRRHRAAIDEAAASLTHNEAREVQRRGMH
jgi:hypothetical protein